MSYAQVNVSSDGRFIIGGPMVFGTTFNPSGVLSIPEKIDGNWVGGIGQSAFINCDELGSVVTPGWVGRDAFAECSKLGNAVFLWSSGSIGEGAFLNAGYLPAGAEGVPQLLVCHTGSQPSITNTLSGPSGVSYQQVSVSDDGRFIFSGGGLIGTTFNPSGVFKIPDTIGTNAITAVGQSGFINCDDIGSVVIPSSVGSIGNLAFADCSKLGKAVFLGSPSIEGGAFLGAGWLPDGETLDSRPLLVCYTGSQPSISNSITGEYSYGVSYQQVSVSDDGLYILSGNNTLAGSTFNPSGVFKIPDTTGTNAITAIGQSAFINCDDIGSVVIPPSVSSIGSLAFADSGKLGKAVLLGSPSVEWGAFLGAGWLPDGETLDSRPLLVCYTGSQPSISNSITGEYSYGVSYQQVSVSDDGLYILSGNNTLAGSTFNPSGVFKIPDTTGTNAITAIGQSAFINCDDIGSVVIPPSVSSIGSLAFADSGKLGKAVLLGSPSVEWGAFLGAGWLPDGETLDSRPLLVCYTGSQPSISNSITGEYSYGVSYQQVSVSDDGLYILSGNNTLAGSTFNPSGVFKIPDTTGTNTITAIGQSAFINCDDVGSVVIPSSVSSIGSLAFADCGKLGKAVFLGSPSVEWGAFLGAGWLPDGETLDSRPLLVCYTGSQPSISNSITGEYSYGVSYQQVSVSDDGLYILSGNNTLAGSTFNPSGVFKIPDTTGTNTITAIGQSAFINCDDVGSVVIPSSVSSIGSLAFADCGKLGKAVFLGSPSVEWGAFLGAGWLPDGGTWDSWAFLVCYTGSQPSISSNSITGGPSYGVYYQQVSVSDDGLYILSDNNTLAGSTFNPSGMLKIPDTTGTNTITAIGQFAFINCDDIGIVLIPPSIGSISDRAFADCSGLNSANFYGNAPWMGWGVFDGAGRTFSVGYRDGSSGFSSPTWLDYPASVMSGDLDADGDGLSDRIESGTGVFVDGSNAGTDPLKPDTNGDGFKDGEAVSKGLNPLTDYSSAIQLVQQISDSEPSRFLLYSQMQYDINRIAGRSDVTSNPAAYNLWTPASIMDLNLGGVMIQKSGATVTVSVQMQTSTNLVTQPFTNSGTPVQLPPVSMPSDKGFLRVRALPTSNQ